MCRRCRVAAAEVSYPDGNGGQTHICGVCELLYVHENGGDSPLWIPS